MEGKTEARKDEPRLKNPIYEKVSSRAQKI
jgi:hypothetical protein